MSDAETKIAPIVEAFDKFRQRHWAASLGRWVSNECNDGTHDRHCLHSDCECACHDPVPKPEPKPRRDKNGLTEEERRDQIDFPFDDYESLEVR